MDKDENIHIGQLIKLFLTYWKIYVPIGIVCLIAAIVFIIVTPKQYTVSASIQLLKEKSGMMSELKMLKSSALGGFLTGGGGDVNTTDQVLIMTTRQNIAEVATKNMLQVDIIEQNGLMRKAVNPEDLPFVMNFTPTFLSDLEFPVELSVHTHHNGEITLTAKSKLFDKIKSSRQQLPYTLLLPCGEITFHSNKEIGDATYKIEISPMQLYYEELIEDISIKPSESISDIVELSIESANVAAAKRLLNGIMQQYNVYSKAKKIEESNLNVQFVLQKLDTVTMDLAYLEHQIEKYKQDNKIPDLSAYGEVTYLGNKEMEKMILEMETQLRMLDYVIAYMQNSKNKFNAIPIVEGLGDKAMLVYNQLILDRQRLLQSSENENPALKLNEVQINEQHKMLFESIISIRSNLNIALEAAYKKDAALSKKVDLLPTQEREFIEIKRQQKIKESIYLFLMQKLQENELANSPDEMAGRVIDAAYCSYKHVFPKASIVLIIAFISACMLSLIAISIKVAATNRHE